MEKSTSLTMPEKSNHEGEGHYEVPREQCDVSTDFPGPSTPVRPVHQDQEKSGTSQGRTKDVEEERDAGASTPPGFTDNCGPIATTHLHPSLSSSSSSSSSGLCLSPPLPPSVELTSVLADTRLTLDVYKGGAAALPLLWASIPEQLMGVQYLTLGSEDAEGLDDALDVVPHLTDLHTLTVRGKVMNALSENMVLQNIGTVIFCGGRCDLSNFPWCYCTYQSTP